MLVDEEDVRKILRKEHVIGLTELGRRLGYGTLRGNKWKIFKRKIENIVVASSDLKMKKVANDWVVYKIENGDKERLLAILIAETILLIGALAWILAY